MEHFSVPTRGVSQRSELWRGSIGSLILRFSYVGLGSLVAIVLARVLGPGDYGVYVYAYALITMLSVPARFGFPALIVRETARLEALRDWQSVKGLWLWANRATGVLTLGIVACAGVVAYAVWGGQRSHTLGVFEWGLALIPLIALGSLRAASLRGLRRVVLGQLPEEIVRPALLVVFVIVIALVGGRHITPVEAMKLHVIAALLAFLLGAWMLNQARPQALSRCGPPRYEARRWILAVLPFAAMDGMFFINNQTDLILLGALSTAKDVGIYKVASQGAAFVALGFQALGMALMPHYAKLHALGERRRFGLLSAAGCLGGIICALPVFVAFLVFGRPILSQVFGIGYAAGYAVLVILSFAQLTNVCFGMPGRLMNAAGYEHMAAWGVLAGAACNVVLNVLLIPEFGSNGAAIATGVSLVLWNVVLWRMAYGQIGIDSSVASIFKRGTIMSMLNLIPRKV